MLAKLWKQWKNARDEKQFAAYEKLDAELGTPTVETLNERARKAAEKGFWKTALKAVEQGADVNQPLHSKQFFSTSYGGFEFERNESLTFLAIAQNNGDALSALLKSGAKTDFTGTSRVNDTTHSYSLAEYAANNGAEKALAVVLSEGKPKQAALDGALAIAAGSNGYIKMAAALLDAGAQGFDAALRKAEVAKNKKAIMLIKSAKASAPAAATPDADTGAVAGLVSAIENIDAGNRRQLFETLQAKFGDDFGAAAPKGADKPGETFAPVPVTSKGIRPGVE
jgi:hypothetical protein